MAFTIKFGGLGNEIPAEVKRCMMSEGVARMMQSQGHKGLSVVRHNYMNGDGKVREGFFLTSDKDSEPIFLLKEGEYTSGAMLRYEAIPQQGFCSDPRLAWQIV